jgi:hypothetical protein
MAGIIIDPIAAVVAAPEPDMAAKNMQATIDTSPRPPDIHPIRVLAKLISLLDIPPLSIRLPASIKNGTAMKGNESVAVISLCGTTSSGTSLESNNVMLEARPSAKAIGIFSMKNIIKLPNNISATLSIDASLPFYLINLG